MGTTVSTIRVGQKPSREEMKRIRAELKEAAKRPIVYTDDCPKSTPEALKEFAMQRAEMNRFGLFLTAFQNTRPSVEAIPASWPMY